MKPTKEEMLNRVSAHLNHCKDSDACNLLWSGYLAACVEWQLLTPNEYHSIRRTLKPLAEKELEEIFLGFDKIE